MHHDLELKRTRSRSLSFRFLLTVAKGNWNRVLMLVAATGCDGLLHYGVVSGLALVCTLHEGMPRDDGTNR